MKRDAQELSDALDLEYWLDREGVPHRLSRGVSGMQVNLKTCPECGDNRYRTYLNLETGRGNCFVCNTTFSKLGFIQKFKDMSWAETFRHVKEVLAEQGWRPRRTITAAVEYDQVKLPLSFPLPTPEGQNLVYLEQRGISSELAAFFHLRYCDSVGGRRLLLQRLAKGGRAVAIFTS